MTKTLADLEREEADSAAEHRRRMLGLHVEFVYGAILTVAVGFFLGGVAFGIVIALVLAGSGVALFFPFVVPFSVATAVFLAMALKFRAEARKSADAAREELSGIR